MGNPVVRRGPGNQAPIRKHFLHMGSLPLKNKFLQRKNKQKPMEQLPAWFSLGKQGPACPYEGKSPSRRPREKRERKKFGVNFRG